MNNCEANILNFPKQVKEELRRRILKLLAEVAFGMFLPATDGMAGVIVQG